MSTPALKFHPRRKVPLHRLPFVGKQHDGTPSFWDVPLNGGYYGGLRAGGELASLMLIHQRQQRHEESANWHLGQVAASWIDAARTATPDQYDALRGQVLGFMAALSPWLIAAVDRLGQNLDIADRHAILRSANRWLSFDDSELFADHNALTALKREG